MNMAQERANAATFKGNPITLIGPELKVGDTAPDFRLNKNLLEEATLQDYAGKIKLISVVPSLDTGVCDAQPADSTRKPPAWRRRGRADRKRRSSFAQARWCGAAGVDRVITLSDYKDNSFGKAYGVLIKEFALDMRAVFVLDKDNKIQYVEVLNEMTEHPDYEKPVAAVKALLS
ncbi:putative thiol peroxidase [Paenibacillus sp. HMSSN-139]|nr:putative thiol peroxidase [Paenibacillus sp. HMSSN-139]